MNAKLTFIHALTALHAGVGQGTGIIDLPIAREKATGIPYLPGSSLKGALRSRSKTQGKLQDCYEIFGPENVDDTNSSAGMIQFSDQHLLLLPVRSLAGTFAWVTSPYILERFARDRRFIQEKRDWEYDLPELDESQCFIPYEMSQQAKIVVHYEESIVYLEDLNLTPRYHQNAMEIAKTIAQHLFPDDKRWQQKVIERFCIVSDDVLSFLLETATQITARIRLQEDSKTVEEGGLWYEEALPAETVLLGLTMAMPTLDPRTRELRRTPEDILAFVQNLINQPLQLGGRATLGQGLCQIHFEKES
jgi:CRISPR-associated protein Cmr4